MAVNGDVTLLSLVRSSPARIGLSVVGPLVLACVQLTNGYLHDLPLAAAAAFAAVMVAYSILQARFLRSRARLQSLEGDAAAPMAAD